jgi:hypothetical protein
MSVLIFRELGRAVRIDGRDLNQVDIGRADMAASARAHALGLVLRAAKESPGAPVAGPCPFHCSARVTFGPTLVTIGTLLVKLPTAVQTDTVGHETAEGLMSYTPGTFGVLWTLHWVPFHRSATMGG